RDEMAGQLGRVGAAAPDQQRPVDGRQRGGAAPRRRQDGEQSAHGEPDQVDATIACPGAPRRRDRPAALPPGNIRSIPAAVTGEQRGGDGVALAVEYLGQWKPMTGMTGVAVDEQCRLFATSLEEQWRRPITCQSASSSLSSRVTRAASTKPCRSMANCG